jgi:hypothetical protein
MPRGWCAVPRICCKTCLDREVHLTHLLYAPKKRKKGCANTLFSSSVPITFFEHRSNIHMPPSGLRAPHHGNQSVALGPWVSLASRQYACRFGLRVLCGGQHVQHHLDRRRGVPSCHAAVALSLMLTATDLFTNVNLLPENTMEVVRKSLHTSDGLYLCWQIWLEHFNCSDCQPWTRPSPRSTNRALRPPIN